MQSADVVGPVDEGATGRLAAAQLRARVGGGRDEDSGVRAGREAGEAEEGGVGKVVGVASRRLCGQTAQREQGEERRQGEHDASEGRRSPRPKNIDDDKNVNSLCGDWRRRHPGCHWTMFARGPAADDAAAVRRLDGVSDQ